MGILKISNTKLSLTRYIRANKRLNLILLAWTLLGSVCITVNGYATANILTNLVVGQMQLVEIWAGVLIGVNLLWSLQIWQSTVTYTRAEQAMSTMLRADIATILTSGTYADFHRQDSRNYVSWLTNDVSRIESLGFDILIFVIKQIVTVALSIGMIFTFHFSLLITIFALALVMTLTAKNIGASLTTSSTAVSKASETLTKDVSDTLNGFDTLLILQKLSIISQRVTTSSRVVSRAKQQYAQADGRLMGITNGLSLVSQVIVLVQAIILYAMHLTPIGAITAASYFSATIFANLSGIGANIMEMRAVQPIFDKFGQLPRITGGQSPVADRLRNEVAFIQAPALTLQNLSFQYENADAPVLTQFSAQIKTGGKYALIGPSGVGKSTIFKLILGLLTPTSGQRQLFGTDYSELSQDSLLSVVAYVEQTPLIFAETVRYNLALGDSFTDKQIAIALEQSGLTTMIATLPAGLETVLSEGGSNISGGQRARVVIARNLLRGKRILLLDEPTAALDKENAAQLLNGLIDLDAITMIMITHQLPDIIRQRLDGVLTLDKY